MLGTFPHKSRSLPRSGCASLPVYEAAFMSSRILVMSSRPGKIVANIEVPFPYQRDDVLRFDPEFARIAGEISEALRGGHAEATGHKIGDEPS